MPVVQQAPALVSPPTNAFGLVQYVAQRVPGYDFSEYLREINAAYIHVWEEVSKLKNHYFTNIKTVTVATAQFEYDFMFNADNGLSAAVSPRLYQITRIRVLPPAGGLYQATRAMTPNDPDFISIAANPTSTPTQTGPYYWYLTGRNQVRWGLPLAVGTTLEVSYTFWPLALTYTFAGTIASSGTAITGTSTTFLQLMQPDFQSFQPSVQAQEEAQEELVGPDSQIYRVKAVTSNTALTLATAPNPVFPVGSAYVLAVLPEIPREHIRVIAAIAVQKMYSLAGDDSRSQEWAAISTSNIQMCKDSLMERQSNNPPSKMRFPYGIGRRNRAFLR